MTWDIVLGIIALAGFAITIGKIVANNTKAMTEIKCSIDNLKDALSDDKKTLENHEHRIETLETTKKR